MDRRVGVYVCTGCGIGDCLDAAKLEEVARSQAATVRVSPALCLDDARLLREDLEAGTIDAAVVAACSPRVNAEVFSFPGRLVERVNLREQVAWSRPARHEETESLAGDALRMGIVRGRKSGLPSPNPVPAERRVLVIGGGAAGLSAALAVAGAGGSVLLVEKGPRLGGFARRLAKRFPVRAPYRDLEDVGIEAQVKDVEAHPAIEVLTETTVGTITGEPGRFEVALRTNGNGARPVTVGAVVWAAGWRPVEPSALARYGLDVSKNVVTGVAFEEMAAAGAIARPSDRRVPRRVAILLADDAEDTENIQRSAPVTCLTALKHARYVRGLVPEAVVYVVYRNMHTPGQHEHFYRATQEDPRILFVPARVTSLSEDAAGGVALELAESPFGTVRLETDLVVLATGMAATPSETDGLGLGYLQGCGLPPSRYGMPDSNFICFPYETRRTGIYAAGCARRPMDLAAAARDGAAAALKAIQAVEKCAAAAAVHPRVGDRSAPSFLLGKCTACGRCSQECPFGAIELTPEKQTPYVLANRCRRCGTCMGACPVQAVSFEDDSVDLLASMMRAIDIPEGDDDKPRILVLACENDAYPALDMAGIGRRMLPACLRIIPVRCLGSVNTILVGDAFTRGFDGVVLLGCRSGDDYQCHFIRGSELLRARMDNVRETLSRLALEAERAQVVDVAISDGPSLPDRLAGFVDSIKVIGLNPMKGF